MDGQGSGGREPKIRVTMLDGFSISWGDRTIDWQADRSKQIRTLLEYLIANRKTAVSVERLYDLLWEDGESGNPANALKNLVYRIRRLLAELSPDGECVFIVFRHGRYAWNNELPCTVDTEEFEKAFDAARRSEVEEKERIRLYRRAVELYRGEFLPGSDSVDWVIRFAARYQSLYAACVTELAALLLKQGECREAALLCQKALEMDPFQESVHEMLIRAYLQAGERTRALDHYRYIANATMEKLGVNLSDGFRQRVTGLLQQTASSESSLDDLAVELEEQSAGSAYFCDYGSFREICRLESRLAERQKLAVFLSLLTVRPADREGDGKKAGKAMAVLLDILLRSLRKGDMVTQVNASQYLVMLIAPGMPEARRAVDRVTEQFGRSACARGARLVARVRRLTPAAGRDRKYAD